MAKKKQIFEAICDTSKTFEQVDPTEIEKGLGASISGKAPAYGSSLSLSALQTRLMRDLVSTGGRPGRREVTSLKKIPLTQSEWKLLEDMTQMLKKRGVKATSGQVAGVLLNQSILEFHRLHEAPTQSVEKISPKELSDSELEETVEGILDAAANAEVHLEQLRPVALELLRRMRGGKGVEGDEEDTQD